MGIRVIGNRGVFTETDLVSKLVIRSVEENRTLSAGQSTFELDEPLKNKDSGQIFLSTLVGGSRVLSKNDFSLTTDPVTEKSVITLNTPVTEPTSVMVKNLKEVGSDVIASTELSDFTNIVAGHGDTIVYDAFIGKYTPKKISTKSSTVVSVVDTDVITEGQTQISLQKIIDPINEKLLIYKNNIPLKEGSDFNVSGDIITLTTPLILTDDIYGFLFTNFNPLGHSVLDLSDVSDLSPSENDLWIWKDGKMAPVDFNEYFNEYVETNDINFGGAGGNFEIKVVDFVFSGQYTYTISGTVTPNSFFEVYVGGLYQPASKYTVSGNELTFIAGAFDDVPSGTNISINHFVPVAPDLFYVHEYTTSTNTTNFNINPLNKHTLLKVYVSGLFMSPSNYTINTELQQVVFNTHIQPGVNVCILQYN
jgi:hypothetical protein